MMIWKKRKNLIKNDYTHISVILDRTGSMESIRDDTIGGFNAFLGEQKAQKGKATLTLVQFDSQDPYEVVHRFKPIKEVPELTRETYVPRATTPLLDALGRGINDLEKSLADMAKKDRPRKGGFRGRHRRPGERQPGVQQRAGREDDQGQDREGRLAVRLPERRPRRHRRGAGCGLPGLHEHGLREGRDRDQGSVGLAFEEHI